LRRGKERLPLPPFSQVLILKEVKVICFDTLLQVLILKRLAEERFRSHPSSAANRGYWRCLGQMTKKSGLLRKYTRGCGGIRGPNGDTVSNLGLEISASVTICQVRN
jgi:hypothetical protein